MRKIESSPSTPTPKKQCFSFPRRNIAKNRCFYLPSSPSHHAVRPELPYPLNVLIDSYFFCVFHANMQIHEVQTHEKRGLDQGVWWVPRPNRFITFIQSRFLFLPLPLSFFFFFFFWNWVGLGPVWMCYSLASAMVT
jgi:hypothetical protein